MGDRKTIAFSALMFVTVAWAFGAFAGQARAQSAIVQGTESTPPPADVTPIKPIETQIVPLVEGTTVADTANFESPRQYERLLRMALGECFRELAGVAPDTLVRIGFDLDGTGGLSGIPEPIGVSTATADVRRLYLKSAARLDDCAPFPPEGTSAGFEIVVSNIGIQTLKRKSERISVKDSPDSPAAVAVMKPATESAEAALALNRAKRSEIQQRLKILGYDPKGVDGQFGKNSRDAIAAWQGDKGFAETGFLNAVQLLALNAQSQAGYAAYVAKNPPKKKKRRRVKVCQKIGILGIVQCRYVYR
jgi:hypothetical protein